jgi:exodeoxyribonuclease V alpha subunit
MNASLRSLGQSGCLRRVDLALAAWVSRGFSGTSDETALTAALAARAVADGHSALALGEAQAWIGGLTGEDTAPRLPDVAAWCESLRHSSAVHVHAGEAPVPHVPLVLDAQGRIYLRRYFEYERQLARSLLARGRLDEAWSPGPGPRSRLDHLDPAQQRAIDAALTHRFTLVTGGPGTGKTYGVLRILVALAQRAHGEGKRLRIALAAPTGKAAARLGESLRTRIGKLDLPGAVTAQIPRDAGTVHSLLGMSPWRTRPRFDRTAPLPLDVVVVDEVSMVDLPLMAKLVDAVPESARLVLLGDPGQLAAVEAGNVLGALVEAANDGPLGDCHVALTHSHRFRADSALAALAASIARGDFETAMHTLDGAGGEATLVDTSRTTRLVDEVVGDYLPVVEAEDPAAALHAARGFRVLTALRHGPSGCLAIDRAIAGRLQRAAGMRADERWWRGRLLMITANRPELGLFNGDTGVVWRDADGAWKAWFEGADGAPRALPVTALPAHEGAFALTVHKAQGSEFERVALVTGPDSAVLTRELLYTGVTRARRGIRLYTTLDTLRAGIERRTLRFTGLADRLREAAHAAGT